MTTTMQMMATMESRSRERTVTRVIGDIHGMVSVYRTIAADAERSVQVGDFGVGFLSEQQHNRVNAFQATRQHQFIRGNHDDPRLCQTMPGWIPDGKIEHDVMYLGGAWSIDHAWRTPGVNWWPDEELSSRELEDMIKRYETVMPRVMITHDGPESAVKQMFDLGETHKPFYPTRTGSALQAMLEIHQPKLHVFGHWHTDVAQKIGNTLFVCLGEFSWIDVDFTEARVVSWKGFTSPPEG